MPTPVRLLRPRASGLAAFPHDPRKLVFVYDTSLEPATNTVSFPVGGSSPNVVVNWGDGLSDTYNTIGFKTHTYASPGVYVVQVSGAMTSLDHGSGNSSTNNKLKLRRCLSFGNIGLTSLSQGFYACANLIQCPSTLPSTVTTLQFCFIQCSAFNDSRVVNWNTALVTAMNHMFQSATVFNQPIGNWGTGAVTAMNSMFAFASAFNQPIGSWNTAAVTSFGNMFNSALAFNQPIGGWNTTATTSFNSMFSTALAFNQPIGSWNTANVTDIAAMFNGAAAFNQPIGGWNTANITAMQNALRGCAAFNQDISGWDIRKVTSLSAVLLSSGAWSTANYDAALIAWAALADTDLKTQAITSFAVSGVNTLATSSGHGMAPGSRVNITGTTNYNGDYNVIAASGTTFTFARTFVANETTGILNVRRSRNVPFVVATNTKYSAGAAATARGVLTGTYGWTITDGGQV